MTNADTKFTNRPKGLLILGGFQLYVAFRAIWNFSFHINASIVHVSIAVLCGIIGIGIMNTKKWAYHAFMVVCAILFIWNVVDAIAGKYLFEQALLDSTMKSLQRAAVSMIYIGWLFYYRRYFPNNTNGEEPIG
jgi:hypothetical protein